MKKVADIIIGILVILTGSILCAVMIILSLHNLSQGKLFFTALYFILFSLSIYGLSYAVEKLITKYLGR